MCSATSAHCRGMWNLNIIIIGPNITNRTNRTSNKTEKLMSSDVGPTLRGRLTRASSIGPEGASLEACDTTSSLPKHKVALESVRPIRNRRPHGRCWTDWSKNHCGHLRRLGCTRRRGIFGNYIKVIHCQKSHRQFFRAKTQQKWTEVERTQLDGSPSPWSKRDFANVALSKCRTQLAWLSPSPSWSHTLVIRDFVKKYC
jgi:hypothetical protein